MANKTSEIATRTTEINLGNPNDIMKFATNLKELIVQNRLSTPIQNKQYVNVEGWQIAGAFTGTLPIVEKVEDLSVGNHYKYRAEVSLQDKEGNKVGYGVAICSNKEKGKQNFDEYAVASMAQTRAVGKAYRMKLGWLLKIAGYETTPAEEMDAVVASKGTNETVEKIINEETPRISKAQIAAAKIKLKVAKDLGELKKIWSGLGEIAKEQELIDVKNEMKERLSNE